MPKSKRAFSLVPEAQDYAVTIRRIGRRVVITSESPAQARSITRQFIELVTNEVEAELESAIGFDQGGE